MIGPLSRSLQLRVRRGRLGLHVWQGCGMVADCRQGQSLVVLFVVSQCRVDVAMVMALDAFAVLVVVEVLRLPVLPRAEALVKPGRGHFVVRLLVSWKRPARSGVSGMHSGCTGRCWRASGHGCVADCAGS